MEQRSPDQLVEWAYDQFLEQAADMLAPNKSSTSPSSSSNVARWRQWPAHADWSTELGEPGGHGTLGRGLGRLCLDHQDEFEVIYATFLLPRIRASTTCISAGTASNRHKKRRPRRLFSPFCDARVTWGVPRWPWPDSGDTSRRWHRSWQRGKLVAPAALDGFPADTAQNAQSSTRRSLAGMSALRAIELGHAWAGSASWAEAVHGGPLAYLGQGAATTEAEPSLARQSPMQGLGNLFVPCRRVRSPRGGCCAPR